MPGSQCVPMFAFQRSLGMRRHLSVASQLAEYRERLMVTKLSLEITLPTFRLNAPVIIRAKVKEVRNNVAIYSHALPRIHIIGGQRSVRITPPSLPPHHSGLTTRDFQSSISVEALFHRREEGGPILTAL